MTQFPINQISRFLIKPTSQNLIKLFENFKTRYEYSYNYKELDKSLEKIIKKLKFDHDNLNEFKEELWQQLAYFKFEYIIWSTLADEIEDGSNDKPKAELNDNIAKKNDKEAENDNLKSATEEYEKLASEAIKKDLQTAAKDFANAIDGGNRRLNFKNDKLSRPLRFFSDFQNHYEDNENDICLKKLSKKNLEFSSILARLITEEKNEHFKSLDIKAGYYDKRYMFPDESINFLSAIILKFFDLGIQKDKNKETLDEDGEYIEKRMDLFFELLILQLIFGKYHHKKLCQIFTNDIMKSLDIEKDTIHFNNSYSSFMDTCIENMLSLFFNQYLILNFYLKGIPNAAITILFREMHYLSYENPLKSDRNFPVIHFCAKLCVLIQETRCLVSPVLEPLLVVDLKKTAKERKNESSYEFDETWGKWIVRFGKILLDTVANKIGKKKLAKINQDKLKIEPDLKTYICPSIAFDIAHRFIEISDVIDYSIDQSEDYNSFSSKEYNEQKTIIAFLQFEKLLNNKYDINPFPTWSKRDIDMTKYFFDARGDVLLEGEKFTNRKELAKNIFCIPFWLEGYYHINLLDENEIFEKYLTIFNYDIFKRNGLENYLPLCFVMNFFNLFIYTHQKEDSQSKIYFDILKFRELYDFMKSSTDYASENYFFEIILSNYLKSKKKCLGILQENFLNSINKNIEKSSEKNIVYSYENTENILRDNHVLKRYNQKKYNELKNIADVLTKIISNNRQSLDIDLINNKLMQLRKILESLLPEKAQKLCMWLNENDNFLKIAKFNKLKTYRSNDNTFSLGAIRKVLLCICKLNKSEINDIVKQAPKGLRSNLKSINLLNDSLIEFEFPKLINTLNNACHHTNKKQNSLQYRALTAIEFMIDEDKLTKIIEALR